MHAPKSVAAPDVERFRKFLVTGAPGPHAYVVLLGLDVFDLPVILERIAKGLPWKTFDRFVRNSGLTSDQVAELIAIPRRTLARRKSEGRLLSDESDRLVRAARVFGRVLELFDGDRAAATDWMTTLNAALGSATPLEYARTNAGAHEVERLIGRIEHGVYS